LIPVVKVGGISETGRLSQLPTKADDFIRGEVIPLFPWRFMFIRFQTPQVVFVSISLGALILNLRAGEYGKFNFKETYTENRDRVAQLAEISISSAKPANITKFGKDQFKEVYDLLKKPGTDKRDIEAQIGKGKPESPNSNKTVYESENGKKLVIDYEEGGFLKEAQWNNKVITEKT
jgi:hypothetical protein